MFRSMSWKGLVLDSAFQGLCHMFNLCKRTLDLDGLMLSGLDEATATLKLHLYYKTNWMWTQAEIKKMQ